RFARGSSWRWVSGRAAPTRASCLTSAAPSYMPSTRCRFCPAPPSTSRLPPSRHCRSGVRTSWVSSPFTNSTIDDLENDTPSQKSLDLGGASTEPELGLGRQVGDVTGRACIDRCKSMFTLALGSDDVNIADRNRCPRCVQRYPGADRRIGG